MKKKMISILILICSLLMIIGPFTIFPVCPSHEKLMKCNWMARAEIGVAIIIATLALLNLIPIMRSYGKGINLAIFFNAILALLLPSVLIGACKSSQMCCRTLAQPAFIVLSLLIILFAFASILLGISFKKRK